MFIEYVKAASSTFHVFIFVHAALAMVTNFNNSSDEYQENKY